MGNKDAMDEMLDRELGGPNAHKERDFTWVSLPDFYGMRREANGRVYGLIVRPYNEGLETADGRKVFIGEIFVDGRNVASILTDYGKERTRKMTLNAFNALINQRGRRLRQKARRLELQEEGVL